MLMRHENLRLKPYLDTVGKLTIGCGRNLDDMGITLDEAQGLLKNDIARCRSELIRGFSWFTLMSEARQDVLTDMIFNLGMPRLLEFRGMIAALQRMDWDKAASEMLASRWAGQVGKRASELANLMRSGVYAESGD